MKKGRLPALLIYTYLMLSLSGCGSVKDYLQTVGLMDPDEYLEDVSASEASDTAFSDEKASDMAASDDKAAVEPSYASAETASAKTSSETGASAKISPEAFLSSEEKAGDQATAEISTRTQEEINREIEDRLKKLEDETGRKLSDNRNHNNSDNAGILAGEASSAEIPGEFVSDAKQQADRENIGINDEDIAELQKSQAGLYAYEHLNDEGKTLYAEVLTILQKHASDIVVSTLDEEALDTVFQFVLADHPEIFYVNGYTYTRYTRDGKLQRLAFSGNYIYDEDKVSDLTKKISEKADEWLLSVPDTSDTYERVKYVYECVIENTEYELNSADNQNIISVFLNGKSVCQGYAKAFQFLLNRLDIPATLVTGEVGGRGHAWNLVKVDGEYYYVDPSWGDASYQTAATASGETQKLPLVNYAYLCCTTRDIKENRTISDQLPMPDCTSMSANYFVREDEYFTSADMNKVTSLFERRYSDGSNNVTIKCSTASVYDELMKQLVDNKQVFGLLKGADDKVSYTTFKDQHIMIFWL